VLCCVEDSRKLNLRRRILCSNISPRWAIISFVLFPSPSGITKSVPTNSLLRDMVEFQFVNYNDPAQNKSTDVRRFIRSHISHFQHEQKRTELGRALRKHRPRKHERSIDAWKLASGPYHTTRHPSTLPTSSASNNVSNIDTDRESQDMLSLAITTTRQHTVLAQGPEAQSHALSPSAYSSKDLVKDLMPATAEPSCQDSRSHTKPEYNIKAEEGVSNRTSEEKAVHDVCPQTSLQHTTPSGSCAAVSERRITPYRSVPQLVFEHLRDPTDELRNWVEVQRISVSSLTVRCPCSQP
jgi:hypothetical protein